MGDDRARGDRLWRRRRLHRWDSDGVGHSQRNRGTDDANRERDAEATDGNSHTAAGDDAQEYSDEHLHGDRDDRHADVYADSASGDTDGT